MSRRPPIRDPQAVPVVGHDAHLPAVSAERLQLGALRPLLAGAAQWRSALRGDAAFEEAADMRPAAVLVPLVLRDSGLQVLLTRRADHLRDHPGQISFPGGRTEPEDADAVATALREAQEEVGLPPAQVEVLGHLPRYSTVTRYVVTPVVGLVRAPLQLALDTHEVAEAFEVPLQFLMNPAHHQRHEMEFEGQRRQFLSMPWQGTGPDGAPRRYFIWGATAAMLRNLYHGLAEA